MIRLILTVFSAFLLVTAFSGASLAKGNVEIGDTIPHNLDLKDQNGKMRSFSDLTGEKGLVLVFIRSAEWCPYCQKQLIELDKNRKDFNDAGYNIASVSYDPVAQLEKFKTKNNPKITLLSDPASKSIRAFGILNIANAKGTFSYGIPYPGVYIVSKDKKVQAKFFEADYKERPSIKELMDEIKKLNPPPAPAYESLDNMGSDPIVPGEDVIDIPEKITDPVVLPEDNAVETPAVDPVDPLVNDSVEAAPEPVPAVDPVAPAVDPTVDPMDPVEGEMPTEMEPDITMPESPADPDMPEVTPTREEPEASHPAM